ncbi:MAG: hypothetical protein Q6361_05035 [Candidatus Hermodarchaeota archaeon]|nr:hypothetical protein [Candidatus Hermodarchaeota archaeon]MDO8123539.1 hypothetical protein [Candidatus Hermodarchaeota archaeon]
MIHNVFVISPSGEPILSVKLGGIDASDVMMGGSTSTIQSDFLTRKAIWISNLSAPHFLRPHLRRPNRYPLGTSYHFVRDARFSLNGLVGPIS